MDTWLNKIIFSSLGNNPNWLTYEPALLHNDLAQYHIRHPFPCTGIIDVGSPRTWIAPVMYIQPYGKPI